MTTLLIDGDIFIYRITAASETPIEWDNDLWTLHSDFNQCKEALDTQIADYKKTLNADDIVIALSLPQTSATESTPNTNQTAKANASQSPTCPSNTT